MNTRQAIQDSLAFAYLGNTATASFLTYLCRIDRSPPDPGYIVAMAVQSAKIRAAVNDQPEPISSWLNYCYAPDVEAINKPLKQAHIADTLITELLHVEQCSHKKAGRLAVIAHIAVEDYRIGQIMGRELPPSSYTEPTGINPANWSRDWEKYRRKALMRIKSFDIAGVAKVSETFKAIREAEEDSKRSLDMMSH